MTLSLVVLVIAASGCSGAATSPPSSPPPPSATRIDTPAPAASTDRGVVLEWRAEQALWGSESFTIEASGRARYGFRPAVPEQPTVETEAMLSPSELSALRQVFESHRFCDIGPSSRQGVPDEARPTLTVAWPGLRCALQLWDREWEQRPDVHECAQAVAQLRDRVRGAGP